MIPKPKQWIRYKSTGNPAYWKPTVFEGTKVLWHITEKDYMLVLEICHFLGEYKTKATVNIITMKVLLGEHIGFTELYEEEIEVIC